MQLNDIIREAEYADIVLSLLNDPYQINSVTKIIFFSFCIKHEDRFNIYRKRTKDFVDVFFQNISLKLAVDYRDIEKILFVLKMLVKAGKISVTDDEIEIIDKFNHSSENDFLKMCSSKVPNPIIEINKLDATAVIEEVIRYV